MRREHYKSQSYIDWLKSLGCVVYLPLSEEGDLQDRISGLSLQLSGNGSLAWDGNQQRYKLTQPSSNQQYVGFLNNGLSASSFPDNKISVLKRVKKITNSSSKNFHSFGANVTYDWDTFDAFNDVYNGGSKTTFWPNYEASVAIVFDANVERRYYQKGALYTTAAVYNPYLPSNWVLDGTGVLIGATSRSTSFLSVESYISELYMFNAALDLQTIRIIQGYE